MSDSTNETVAIEAGKARDHAPSAEIRPLIHTLRDEQVILDSDLARLYGVETKVFNWAVKRNARRFPERFRFRLTEEEFDRLRSQSVTSSGHGGRRYLPYAFTEQGVAMRHFLAENAAPLERLRGIESSQAAFQQSTDERFDRVFRLLEGEIEKPQRIFFAGQMFDAFSLLTDLVSRSEREIVLVDGYVDVRTLNILAKKREGVAVAVYTSGTRLTQDDVDVFNAQYPSLTVLRTRAFHDRFLILDGETAYHIGASLKDAGKKCFGIDLIQDEGLTKMLIEKLRVLDEQSAT